MSKLQESELGMLLLSSGGTGTDMYDLLADKTTCDDPQCMYGSDVKITYSLFPLNKDMKTKAKAIRSVFDRWTQQGYNKHHAKDPFACQAFMTYLLDDLKWNEADYLLLALTIGFWPKSTDRVQEFPKIF